MNTKEENATVKNNVVADTTVKSLHNIIERYGDAGFWNTLYSTFVKFQHGGCASTACYPMSAGMAGSILALRWVAGFLSILEAGMEEIEQHISEKKKKESLALQEVLLEELIANLMPLINEINAENAVEELWAQKKMQSLAQINEILLHVFHGVYKENAENLTVFDEHVKYSILRSLDAMPKSRNPRKYYLRIIQAIGDFIYGNVFGISFVAGIATLLMLIPGVNVVMLGVLISGLAIGLLYGLLKVVRNLYSDRKHDYIGKRLVDQNKELKKTLILLTGLDYAQNLGKNTVNVIFQSEGKENDYKALDLITEPKGLWRVNAGLKLFYIANISAVVGASSVYTINTLVSNFGTIACASIGLSGVALTAIPIVGVVITFLFYAFKLMIGFLESVKHEQSMIAAVNQQLKLQNTKAEQDVMMQKVIGLNNEELLLEFITQYLGLGGENTLDNEVFVGLIEDVIGFKKSEAKTLAVFYGYLAFVLTHVIGGEEAKELVAELMLSLEDVLENELEINIEEKFKKQNLIFRYNQDGTVDHKGNFKRFLSIVKEVYKFVLNVSIPIVIGLAIGLIYAVGPAFPIVAGVFAALLLGVYILNKVLEYKQNQRIKSYQKEQSLVVMRDKVVEYNYISARQQIEQPEKKHHYGRFFSEMKTVEVEEDERITATVLL